MWKTGNLKHQNVFSCNIFSGVADPGCLFRIQGQKYSGSRIRIRIREFKYFYFLTLKTVSKLSKKLSGTFIPDPGSGFFFILDPGSRGQKDTGSRIRNTDIFFLRRDEKRLGKVILKNPLSWSRLIRKNYKAQKYRPNKLQIRFSSVPDPTYHFDADPDFYLMRMRIRVPKMMRIRVPKMMRIRVPKMM